MQPSFLTPPLAHAFQSKSLFLTSRSLWSLHVDPVPPRRRQAVLLDQLSFLPASVTPLTSLSVSQPGNGHIPQPPCISGLPQIDEVRKLAKSRGALGRGVRATLRAFHRRANFGLSRQRQTRNSDPRYVFYAEIGPAYVLAVGRLGVERVTRYAVEQRAWPALRSVIGWEELSTTEARQRGATLRKLEMNVRYGRHVFLSYEALATMIAVAEELIMDTPVEQQQEHDGDVLSSVLNMQIEAVIPLKKKPIAGVRTVAVKCPRRDSHRNGDRNPSLLLWMNEDGLTGGAMCPVCMESNCVSKSAATTTNYNKQFSLPKVSSSKKSAAGSSKALHRIGQSSRHMTWRVHYIQRDMAVICTPYRRIQSPPHVSYAMDEWRIRKSHSEKKASSNKKKVKKRLRSVLGQNEAHDNGDQYSSRSTASPSGKSVNGSRLDDVSEESQNPTVKRNEMVVSDTEPYDTIPYDANFDIPSSGEQGIVENECASPRDSPVGGHLLRSAKKLSQIGKVSSLAYVTASLKIARNADTAWMNPTDGTKLRTVGRKARLSCPMQVLLWSERRSKGPTSARRVEDVAWYARQSILNEDSDDNSGGDSEPANGGHNDLNHSTSLNGQATYNPFDYRPDIDTALDVFPGSTETSSSTVESEDWLPTPVVSISVMRPNGWRDVLGANGQLVSVPTGWEPTAQAWVLFDMDDVSNLDNDTTVQSAASKMTLAVRRNVELSGRCLVLQTGPRGLHVWAELREVRVEPRTWFKLDETRQWYMETGNKLLRAAQRGGAKDGKVDPSSCSAGRFARRPGWRLLEDGSAFRSRVITYVPSRVKSRLPRTSRY